MSFTQRLRRVQFKQNSLLCIGLDVDINKIPAHLQSMEHPVLELSALINQTLHFTKQWANTG